MGDFITLTAADGHSLAAYEVKPAGKPRGGLVIVQEIFGVNEHIRWVADGYAADGYHVVAPALFDRHERGYDRGYSPEEREAGLAMMKRLAHGEMLADIAAAVAKLAPEGKVGVVGYCLGGSLAYLAAAQLDGIAAAVGYYGGLIAGNLDKQPKVPVMLHFGDKDVGITMEAVEKIRAAVDPARVQIFVYPGAGHAFNRFGNQAWHEPSARLARERTVAFLRQWVG